MSALNVAEFAQALAGHPDPVSYVLNGLQYGFRLGFHPTRRLKSAKRNKLSAELHPCVIDDYLANEVAFRRVVGPFVVPRCQIYMLAVSG